MLGLLKKYLSLHFQLCSLYATRSLLFALRTYRKRKFVFDSLAFLLFMIAFNHHLPHNFVDSITLLFCICLALIFFLSHFAFSDNGNLNKYLTDKYFKELQTKINGKKKYFEREQEYNLLLIKQKSKDLFGFKKKKVKKMTIL